MSRVGKAAEAPFRRRLQDSGPGLRLWATTRLAAAPAAAPEYEEAGVGWGGGSLWGVCDGHVGTLCVVSLRHHPDQV